MVPGADVELEVAGGGELEELEEQVLAPVKASIPRLIAAMIGAESSAARGWRSVETLAVMLSARVDAVESCWLRSPRVWSPAQAATRASFFAIKSSMAVLIEELRAWMGGMRSSASVSEKLGTALTALMAELVSDTILSESDWIVVGVPPV